eukprot:scaffold7756_cov267-Pinguiococcus_pyrenoidosus.AAC.2
MRRSSFQRFFGAAVLLFDPASSCCVDSMSCDADEGEARESASNPSASSEPTSVPSSGARGLVEPPCERLRCGIAPISRNPARS